jgi:hypothetical protein
VHLNLNLELLVLVLHLVNATPPNFPNVAAAVAVVVAAAITLLHLRHRLLHEY